MPTACCNVAVKYRGVDRTSIARQGLDVVAVERLADVDVDVVEDIAGVRVACAPSSRFAQVSRAGGHLAAFVGAGQHAPGQDMSGHCR